MPSPDRFSEAERLRVLNAFAVKLMSIPSTDDLFWYVAQNVVGKLGFVDCVVYAADADQTRLMQVSAWGEKNPFDRSIVNPLVIPFGKGITGQVAQDKRPVIVDDLSASPNYIPDTQIARSEICVPILSGARVLGVIDSEHPDRAAFGREELELLTTVAAMTGAKMALLAETERSNARYSDLVAAHGRLTAEIDTRKALEANLHEARKLEALGRLTGRFAHEFNNLLTVIQGNLELLGLENHDEVARELINSATAASTRGATLISDMLAFAQKTRLTPTVLDMNAAVRRFRDGCDATLQDRISLSLVNAQAMVLVDENALTTVLTNLMMNALDAMPEGSTLPISTETVFHTSAEDRHLLSDIEDGFYVRVRVRDHGHGIDEKVLPQIFDPFFSTKGPTEATGLGLSIVLGVMRQSGGTVGVHSVPGHGSTFDLYFPAAPSDGNELLTIR